MRLLSRYRTYVDGVTQVPAGDMNGIQDDEIETNNTLIGSYVLHLDDFMGSAIDTGKWVITGGASTTADNTNGGYGAAQFTTSDGTVPNINTNAMAIGAVDFVFEARVRVSSMGGAGSYFEIGVQDGVTKTVLFRAQNGAANWQARDDFDGSIGNTDSAVAYLSTYQKLKIRRTSGLYEWLINDAVVYSITPAIVTNTNAAPIATAVRAASGTTTAFVDYMKFWCTR